MSDVHGWTAHTSKQVYENAWLRLREDRVTRPDGSGGIYGVVEVKHPAVFVVALTDADEVALVELYRYPTDAVSLEIPAGAIDDGESPLDAARRELAEEAGMEADDWTELGRKWALNGLARAEQFVYLARGARRRDRDGGTSAEQALEGISDVRTIPWADALDLVRTGGITDSETIASLMLALLHRDGGRRNPA